MHAPQTQLMHACKSQLMQFSHHTVCLPQANRSNIARARTLYELALEADPQHLQSLLGLGSLEARAGSVDRGLALLHDGLRLQPGNKQIRHMIAQWQRKHGEREVNIKAQCRQTVCLSVCLSVCLYSGKQNVAKRGEQQRHDAGTLNSVYLYVFVPLHTYACLPVCLSVCLSVLLMLTYRPGCASMCCYKM